MEILLKQDNLSLIKRWNNYYITWIIDENMNWFPAQIKITPKDKEKILKQNKIRPIFDLYLNKNTNFNSRSFNYYITNGISDYLNYKNVEFSQIQKYTNLLVKYPAISRELYESLAFEKLPECGITVRGVSAKDMHEHFKLNLFNSYMGLIYLKINKFSLEKIEELLKYEIIANLEKSPEKDNSTIKYIINKYKESLNNTSIDTNNLDRLYLVTVSDYNKLILDKMHEIDVLKKEEAFA